VDTVHESDRQTDGQTDRQNYDHKDRATHGKNECLIIITSPASGSEILQIIGLSVCHTMHIILKVGKVLNIHLAPTSCQLVPNFREFFHLHPWFQHDCGPSLLSTIALL